MTDYTPMLLAELPRVITQPGFYRTRAGKKAQIHTIDQTPIMLTNGFAAKGGIEREFRGKPRIKGHCIWHVSGRAYPLVESSSDIVAPWP